MLASWPCSTPRQPQTDDVAYQELAISRCEARGRGALQLSRAAVTLSEAPTNSAFELRHQGGVNREGLETPVQARNR
jgi:hypothetical protein